MNPSLYSIPLRRIDGRDASLGEFQGQVILVVNVASKCGLTPQYEGLEKLYRQFHDRGLVVAGFPSNDFAGQEPGTNAEIQAFCASSFDVSFPLFEKITVVGADKHPLYKALTEERPAVEDGGGAPFREKLKGYGLSPNPEPEVLWNFEKFLVNREGMVVKRFSPDTTPEDPSLLSAVKSELA